MSNALICVLCNQPVVVNKQYYSVHEKMHWLCFHIVFEHQADPDEPCGDPSCPQWHIQILKRKLVELGYDPEQVIWQTVAKGWPWRE